jgi:hypothetical protein
VFDEPVVEVDVNENGQSPQVGGYDIHELCENTWAGRKAKH